VLKKEETAQNRTKYVSSNTFARAHDYKRAESICKITRNEIADLLHEPLLLHIIPDVEKGEVLIDSRSQALSARYQTIHDSSGLKLHSMTARKNFIHATVTLISCDAFLTRLFSHVSLSKHIAHIHIVDSQVS
jgi:hypothetical protein